MSAKKEISRTIYFIAILYAVEEEGVLPKKQTRKTLLSKHHKKSQGMNVEVARNLGEKMTRFMNPKTY